MRTYKDIEVKYYDTKGDVHVRCSVPVTEDALVHFELMQSHYCKLSLSLAVRYTSRWEISSLLTMEGLSWLIT